MQPRAQGKFRGSPAPFVSSAAPAPAGRSLPCWCGSQPRCAQSPSPHSPGQLAILRLCRAVECTHSLSSVPADLLHTGPCTQEPQMAEEARLQELPRLPCGGQPQAARWLSPLSCPVSVIP